MFNPFDSPDFSKKNVELLFGAHSDARLAQRTKTENPVLYAQVKEQAIKMGLIDPPREHVWAENFRYQQAKQNQVFTTAEIEARSVFSEADCRTFLHKGDDGNQDSLGNMMKNNPARYEQFRVACVSYGLLAPRPPKPAPAPKPTQPKDDRLLLTDDLADAVNMPHGAKVAPEQLENILRIVAEQNQTTANAAKKE